jgi:hypothetical protein
MDNELFFLFLFKNFIDTGSILVINIIIIISINIYYISMLMVLIIYI